jgi:hypothetical protein
MMPRRRVYGAQHGQGSEPAGRPRARIGYDHLEAAIDLLRTGGRAAICGMISGDGKLPGLGPGNLTRLIIKPFDSTDSWCSITCAGGQLLRRRYSR